MLSIAELPATRQPTSNEPPDSYEDLRSELQTLRRCVEILASTIDSFSRRSRGVGDRALLSKREAARRLGIDRCKALDVLITSGQLNVVHVNGGVRIPSSEVERLAQAGFDTDGVHRREAAHPRPASRRSPRDVEAAILKLKL